MTHCEVGSEKAPRSCDWDTWTCHEARRPSTGGRVRETTRSALSTQPRAHELPLPRRPPHPPPPSPGAWPLTFMSETDGKHRLVGRCLMVATLDSMATLSAARDGLEAGTISSGLSAMEMVVGTGVSGGAPETTRPASGKVPCTCAQPFPCSGLDHASRCTAPRRGARTRRSVSCTPTVTPGRHTQTGRSRSPWGPTLPGSHIFTGAAWIRADGTYS